MREGNDLNPINFKQLVPLKNVQNLNDERYLLELCDNPYLRVMNQKPLLNRNLSIYNYMRNPPLIGTLSQKSLPNYFDYENVFGECSLRYPPQITQLLCVLPDPKNFQKRESYSYLSGAYCKDAVRKIWGSSGFSTSIKLGPQPTAHGFLTVITLEVMIKTDTQVIVVKRDGISVLKSGKEGNPSTDSSGSETNAFRNATQLFGLVFNPETQATDWVATFAQFEPYLRENGVENKHFTIRPTDQAQVLLNMGPIKSLMQKLSISGREDPYMLKADVYGLIRFIFGDHGFSISIDKVHHTEGPHFWNKTDLNYIMSITMMVYDSNTLTGWRSVQESGTTKSSKGTNVLDHQLKALFARLIKRCCKSLGIIFGGGLGSEKNNFVQTVAIQKKVTRFNIENLKTMRGGGNIFVENPINRPGEGGNQGGGNFGGGQGGGNQGERQQQQQPIGGNFGGGQFSQGGFNVPTNNINVPTNTVTTSTIVTPTKTVQTKTVNTPTKTVQTKTTTITPNVSTRTNVPTRTNVSTRTNMPTTNINVPTRNNINVPTRTNVSTLNVPTRTNMIGPQTPVYNRIPDQNKRMLVEETVTNDNGNVVQYETIQMNKRPATEFSNVLMELPIQPTLELPQQQPMFIVPNDNTLNEEI